MAPHEIDASNSFFLRFFVPTRTLHEYIRVLSRLSSNGSNFRPSSLCFASHVFASKEIRHRRDSNHHPPDLIHDELDHRATVSCWTEPSLPVRANIIVANCFMVWPSKEGQINSNKKVFQTLCKTYKSMLKCSSVGNKNKNVKL